LFGPKVLQNAQNLYLKFVDLVSGKYCFADSTLARADLAEREYRGLSEKVRCYNQEDNQTQDGHTFILVPFEVGQALPPAA